MTERYRPIWSGVNPRPPYSIGVERKRGSRQKYAPSRKASVA
jgi:hypothetical protein